MADLDAARAAYEQADADREAAWATLREAAVAAVNAGVSEVEAARRAGVSRTTLRAWLGK